MQICPCPIHNKNTIFIPLSSCDYDDYGELHYILIGNKNKYDELDKKYDSDLLEARNKARIKSGKKKGRISNKLMDEFFPYKNMEEYLEANGFIRIKNIDNIDEDDE